MLVDAAGVGVGGGVGPGELQQPRQVPGRKCGYGKGSPAHLWLTCRIQEGNQVCESEISSFGSWVSPGQSGAPISPILEQRATLPQARLCPARTHLELRGRTQS